MHDRPPKIPVTGGCKRAPRGWWCSRHGNHDGPCAARPRWWNVRGHWLEAQTGTSRLVVSVLALYIAGALVLACGLIFGFLIGVLTLV